MTDTEDPDAGHPVTGLDEVVHQRVRLDVLTIAHEARRVEFGYLRTQLDLTAGNLSKHLSVLEAAGLIDIGNATKPPWPYLDHAHRGRHGRAHRGDRAIGTAHRPHGDHPHSGASMTPD